MLFQYLPRKMKPLTRREDGSLVLNEENLQTLCLMEGLYEYPELNTKLYLMYKSITKIEGLSAYKNLKALYLENNLIKKIEGLEPLVELESLFLHNNMITVIENLTVPKLKILNLSCNQIWKLEGLSHLLELQSLTITHNYLKDYESVEHLKECSPTLTNIDLSHNKLEGDQAMIGLFINVKCLNLMDNPCVREQKFYRRTMIGHLPNLMYLDSRGIDAEERMIAQAWVRGGDEALKKVKDEIMKNRQLQKQQRSQEVMQDIDRHRSGKIVLFKGAIDDCKREIARLENAMKELGHQHGDYYQRRIQQQRIMINDYYDMIISIERRLGKVVTVKEAEYEVPLLLNAQQEQPSESTEPRQSSESDVKSSSGKQEEEIPPYYDELD